MPCLIGKTVDIRNRLSYGTSNAISTTDGAPLLLKALQAISGTLVSTNHVEKYNSNFVREDLQLTSSSPAACVVLT